MLSVIITSLQWRRIRIGEFVKMTAIFSWEPALGQVHSQARVRGRSQETLNNSDLLQLTFGSTVSVRVFLAGNQLHDRIRSTGAFSPRNRSSAPTLS